MADAAAGNAAKPSSSVKLVLLGEAAVGKSSLVLRFVSSTFHPSKEPTIGAAFLTKKLSLPSRTIKFEIWDTAGQERFASLAPMYYRNAQAALVVYDLTKKSSLQKAKHWVAELQRQASPGIVIGFVGNKRDLCSENDDDDDDGGGGGSDNGAVASSASATGDADGVASPTAGEQHQQDAADADSNNDGDSRRISTAEAKSYADNEGLLFFETSAKSGLNVNEVFSAIANAIPEASLKGPRRAGSTAQRAGQIGGGGADGGLGNAANRVDLAGGSRGQGAKDGCAC